MAGEHFPGDRRPEFSGASIYFFQEQFFKSGAVSGRYSERFDGDFVEHYRCRSGSHFDLACSVADRDQSAKIFVS